MAENHVYKSVFPVDALPNLKLLGVDGLFQDAGGIELLTGDKLIASLVKFLIYKPL